MNNVLIIDDDPDFFLILESMLQGEGLTLHYIQESVRALQAIADHQPLIILTDLMMPKQNGIELCRQIKGNPEFAHIPIILLTGMQDERLLAKSLEAGANDFLNKDVSGSELRARVRSMIRFRRQYDDLRRSIQLREDVAHMIVHDLGNPLATIMLEVDDLLTEGITPVQRQSLEKIKSNAKRLQGMSHDMLMIAKMEHGKLRLELQNEDLLRTVQDAVSNLSSQSRRRKLNVEIHPCSIRTEVSYDANLILRVLENILSNAVKFSPVGSTIEIELGEKLEAASGKRTKRVEIRDNGPGIPAELTEKVFEKFEVVKFNKSTPQVGLGLAFCRMAVEAHGGKIGVLPNAPKGSILWFEI